MKNANIKRIVLEINLQLRSPFLFLGLNAGHFGLDTAALRNFAGSPLVPADQLRGVLRHAMAEIADARKLDAVAIDAMFGQSSADARDGSGDHQTGDGFSPRRGRIHFADLVMKSTGETVQSCVANRVSINEETGAADLGGLLFLELVARYGKEVVFEGKAVIFASDDEKKVWIPALQAAATRISAIGAMKSAGFGEVIKFDIKASNTPQMPSAKPAEAPKGLVAYRLTIDRPFLIDARRAADNVYVGSPVIPGGALKGLLARHLELAGQLNETSDSLTALRISHARMEGGERVLPLSLVASDGQSGAVVGDALAVPFGKGATLGGRAALFQADWKEQHWKAAADAVGYGEQPQIRRSVRMHVAIDRNSGTASDQQLFLANAVDPAEAGCWITQVDFSGVTNDADRDLFAGILEAGMDGLGHTNARIDFVRAEADVPAPVPIKGCPGCFAIVLQSDAVMVSPADSQDAGEAYSKYWKRVLPDAELKNFYASQCLAGGYIARRYQVGSDYAPFWLTRAGSVFLLSGSDPEHIKTLVTNGLPAPEVNGEPTTWQTCPYQPENGYGGISADYDPTTLWAEVKYV